MKPGRKEILIVLLIALLSRILLFIAILDRNNPEGFMVYDSYGYLQIANNLKAHAIFSQDFTDDPEPDYFRTPLYPLLILLCSFGGDTIVWSIVIQILISSLTALVTMHLAAELGAGKRIALAAGILFAIEPASICFTSLLLTETLFLFLFTSSLLYLIRFIRSRDNKPLYLFTLLFSLAMLTRPVAAYLGLILLPFLYFIRPKKIRSIIYSFLLFCLICSPWFIRNTATFGKPFLTLLDDQMLLFYHASSVVSEKNKIPLQEAQSILWTDALQTFPGEPKKEPKEFSEFVRDKAMTIIRKNSGIYIRQHLQGVFSILVKPVRGYFDAQLASVKGYQSQTPGEFPVNDKMVKSFFTVSSTFSMIMAGLQILILAFCYLLLIPGLKAINRHSIFSSLVLIITLFYFVNMVVPPFNEGRLRLPIMPILIVAGLMGLQKVLESYGDRKRSKS